MAALEGKARPRIVEARHEAQPRVDGTRGRLAVARASAAAEFKGAKPGGGRCAVGCGVDGVVIFCGRFGG